MHASQVTAARDLAPGAPERARLVGVVAQPRARAARARRARRDDEPGLAGRARPRAGRRRRSSSRPASRRGTPRTAPSRSPRRPARSRRRGSARRGRRAARRSTRPANSTRPLSPRSRASRSRRSRSGPSPAITTRSVGSRGGRLEQQVDPLRAVEPVDREDEVVVAVAAVGERLRRVRQHLGVEPGRALEPVGDVARGREERPRLAERRRARTRAPAGAARGPPPTRRTGRARCGRGRRPAGTGAGARRPCADAGPRTTGTSSRSRASIGRPFASSRSSEPPEERLRRARARPDTT